MSTPPPGPRVVIPNTSKRDLIIGLSIGLLIFAFLGMGIMHMASPVTGNKVTGIIVGRQFTPFKERQISFSGRKLEDSREIDGEYVLKVRVEAENRVYEVPVEKPVYLMKKDGESLTFIRPPSEQR